jgi:long-chain acyl-CoA synthetase
MDRPLMLRQPDDAEDHFAAALPDSGSFPDDCVTIHLPKCPQFVTAFCGTLRARGVAVPSNPLCAADELEHPPNYARVQFLVTLCPFCEKFNTIKAKTSIRHFIAAKIRDCFPPILRPRSTLTRGRKSRHRDDRVGSGTTLDSSDLSRGDRALDPTLSTSIPKALRACSAVAG